MSDHAQDDERSAMVAMSNAMIALHKEQFGRGPVSARSHYCGQDCVVCVLEDAMVSASFSKRSGEAG